MFRVLCSDGNVCDYAAMGEARTLVSSDLQSWASALCPTQAANFIHHSGEHSLQTCCSGPQSLVTPEESALLFSDLFEDEGRHNVHKKLPTQVN